MPWRFYRYMLADVLRQFAITAVILVVVIAFGAAIKPLSGDRLLSGWDTIKYLALAIVPMLQFALPFASAFAATLVLHRMTQDNEIVAMALCGQSYIRLLAPMALFGLILTVTVAILTQSIIPMFIGKMAQAMTADLPRLLTNSIRQHTPFVQGDLVIWAEGISLDGKKDEERMALDHVAVAKLDRHGRAKMYLTASAAVVDIQRIDEQTSLLVWTSDTTQWTRGEDGAGILRGAREGRLTHAIDLPSVTMQRPSSLTRGELLGLRDDPLKYPPVEGAAIGLKSRLLKSTYLKALNELFTREGRLRCMTQTGGRQFIIEADAMQGAVFIPPISVTTIRGTGESRLLEPNDARILVDQSQTGEIESITLQMKDVMVGVGEVGENQRGELVVPSLLVEGVDIEPTGQVTISELFALAHQVDKSDVKSAADWLQVHLAAMDGQIRGRIGQRWAVSFLPLLAILLGSLLAIRLPDQIPLGVYIKVFIPTVIALLCVFAGGQMVRDAKDAMGFSVMWFGNVVLVALVLFHWSRLRLT